VIVSYDSLDYLRDCLASLPAGVGRLSREVIVIDNASGDPTVEWLARSVPSVRCLPNRRNLGFARACNQGLRAAHGRFLLLLNPDTVVGNRAIESTVAYLERRQRVAAASCKVVRPDGRLDLSCKREFPSVWDAFARFVGLSRLFPRSRIFARYDARYLDEDAAQEVPLIDGCFMLIRREALEEIGLLDDRFFMYAEEMDWCRRARSHGWRIGYEPAGTTLHIKGASTRQHTFRMLYHFHRSMLLYYWKHGGHPVLGTWIVLPSLVVRFLALVVVNLCRRERYVSA